MNKAKQETEDNIKTEYRAGFFLPEDYKSQEPDPRVRVYLAEANNREAQLEELNQKIILLRNNLNL